MAIHVKTESKITGSSEHVVTEDGLKAFGIDPKATDPDEARVTELVKFLGWLQTMDAFQGGASPTLDDHEAAARLYLGLGA